MWHSSLNSCSWCNTSWVQIPLGENLIGFYTRQKTCEIDWQHLQVKFTQLLSTIVHMFDKCDMINVNQSFVGNIDFKIQPLKENNFFCFLLFFKTYIYSYFSIPLTDFFFNFCMFFRPVHIVTRRYFSVTSEDR